MNLSKRSTRCNGPHCRIAFDIHIVAPQDQLHGRGVSDVLMNEPSMPSCHWADHVETFSFSKWSAWVAFVSKWLKHQHFNPALPAGSWTSQPWLCYDASGGSYHHTSPPLRLWSRTFTRPLLISRKIGKIRKCHKVSCPFIRFDSWSFDKIVWHALQMGPGIPVRAKHLQQFGQRGSLTIIVDYIEILKAYVKKQLY